MVRLSMFGQGLSLQIAIMVACEMAFILFGTVSVMCPLQSSDPA